MAHDKDTADDVIRALKQPPSDLKVLIYKYGEFRPVEQIKTRYVVPIKYASGFGFYTESDKNAKGAIQVITIS